MPVRMRGGCCRPVPGCWRRAGAGAGRWRGLAAPAGVLAPAAAGLWSGWGARALPTPRLSRAATDRLQREHQQNGQHGRRLLHRRLDSRAAGIGRAAATWPAESQ